MDGSYIERKDDDPKLLRRRAERHRRTAESLTLVADREIVLDEARIADSKAGKAEAEVGGKR